MGLSEQGPSIARNFKALFWRRGGEPSPAADSKVRNGSRRPRLGQAKGRALPVGVVCALLIAGGSLLPAQSVKPVAPSAREICPVLAGTPVPDVSFQMLDGRVLKLREAVSKKPTVLIFYRGGW